MTHDRQAEFDVLIVGAGHGGAAAAIALRHLGFERSIGIVGEEPELPYERPPLTKDYLSGARGFDQILIRSPEFWTKKRIVVFPGSRVVRVDPRGHKVITEDGRSIGYGQLIWSTGGQARTLGCPGHSLRGVWSIRSRADVDRISVNIFSRRLTSPL
jgi:3-phenylpropionate/trans-cinnamate dioxygenase ferredoxin reductase subunit